MKPDLRRRLLSLRAGVSPEDRRRQSRAVADRLRGLPLFRQARTILGYHPLPTELDPTEPLVEAVRLGRIVALPRTAEAGLAAHQWTPGDPLVRSRFGVLEPGPDAPTVAVDGLDVVLVPGIGFDVRGHRLGWGHGYYDRFLARVPQGRIVGLALDVQLVERLPAEPHDIRAGWILTHDRTIHLQPGGD